MSHAEAEAKYIQLVEVGGLFETRFTFKGSVTSVPVLLWALGCQKIVPSGSDTAPQHLEATVSSTGVMVRRTCVTCVFNASR